MKEAQKTRIIQINPYSLALLLTEGNKLSVTKGIAEGTQLIGAGYNPNNNMFYLQVQNDSFKAVKTGDLLPSHEIKIEPL